MMLFATRGIDWRKLDRRTRLRAWKPRAYPAKVKKWKNPFFKLRQGGRSIFDYLISSQRFFFTEHFQRAPVLETLSFSRKIPIGIFSKIPIGMTLSLSEKIPIGIFQNPCTGDFEFERKNPYREFPKSLYWRL